MKDFYRFDNYLMFNPTIYINPLRDLQNPNPTRLGKGKRDHFYEAGALHIHCQEDFVMRYKIIILLAISMSDNKYQVIKLPMNTDICQYKNHFLGRSMRGVKKSEYKMIVHGYCTTRTTLEIPVKMTSMTIMKLTRCTSVRKYCYEYDSASYKNQCEDIKKDVLVRVNKFEWDSDNDDILDTGNPNEGGCRGFLSILGFHPYKEVQNLASMFPKPYDDLYIPGIMIQWWNRSGSPVKTPSNLILLNKLIINFL
uniref:Uncharacterized protein n=1 Tax=Oryza punctata TaxID=4537 RepID=A0A0E0KHE0_ORYPU